MENQTMYLKPEAIIAGSEDAGCTKARTKSNILLIKAVIAGAFIAFGAAGSTAAIYNITDFGMAKLIAGIIFPAGLILVVIMGAELFTGDCLMVFSVFGKSSKLSSMLRVLSIVYVGNLAGSLLIALFISLSGQFDYSGGVLGGYVIKLAAGKLMNSPLRMVISGVLCNILVCIAVLVSSAAKDIAGKILAIFFPIMIFVIGGYEHCIANMYYIPAGLLAKMNPVYVESAQNVYGVTQQQISELTAANMVWTNLLPVTIGNILGGIVFVALPLFIIYRKKGGMKIIQPVFNEKKKETRAE